MNTSPQLKINKPCHENWNSMTPEQQGRSCAVCCKVVVDFTEMPTEKVVEYISTRSSEKICGRFNSNQVSVPKFYSFRTTFTGRLRSVFAAVAFIFSSAFFSSCRSKKSNQHTMGDVTADFAMKPRMEVSPIPNADSPVKQDRNYPKGHVNIAPQNPPPAKDTMKMLMGKVAAPK